MTSGWLLEGVGSLLMDEETRIKSYKELLVWQNGSFAELEIQLVVSIELGEITTAQPRFSALSTDSEKCFIPSGQNLPPTTSHPPLCSTTYVTRSVN